MLNLGQMAVLVQGWYNPGEPQSQARGELAAQLRQYVVPS